MFAKKGNFVLPVIERRSCKMLRLESEIILAQAFVDGLGGQFKQGSP
jgi:hypothetical protein